MLFLSTYTEVRCNYRLIHIIKDIVTLWVVSDAESAALSVHMQQ